VAPTETRKGGWFRGVRRAFRESVKSAQRPDLGVAVVVPTSQISHSSVASLPDAIEQALSGYAEPLGVPARFLVKVEPSLDAGTDLRVLIAGRAARVVPDELSNALAAHGLTRSALQSSDGEEFAVAVTTACRVAVEWDPSVLVGANQRDVVQARAWRADIRNHDDDVLVAALLEYVVAYGISIADLSPLKAALDEQVDPIETAAELSEIAVQALRPASITVSAPEATLRAATLTGMRRDAFAEMRHRLFTELGVTFPGIQVAVDDTVPDRTAVVQLNHVRFTARPLLHDGGVASIAAVVERQLRNHAAWFVSLAEVRRTIDEVRPALPDLVETMQERYSDPQLSRFARTLVEERVPVRNAARLMMLLLDTPAESTGRDLVRLAETTRGAGRGAERTSPRQLVSFTRQELNEETTRSKPGVVTVHTARLPAGLDTVLAETQARDGALDGKIAGPVADQLIDLAEQQIERGNPTLVAATQRSRAAAKNLLARQYPEVVVLAAEEYPPSWRLEPVE
jgi:hypothetical protein